MTAAMTKSEREAFLADVHVGVLSIPHPAKGPLAVPIWYDYQPGGDVWMITGESSLKGRLLADASRISLCVQDETPPYRYVSVEGPFTVSAVADGQLLRMATRYLGAERGREYVASAESANGGGVIIAIAPETWYTVDYGKR